MGRRRYTEEQFREAVADPTVTTIAELCRRLGLVPSGGIDLSDPDAVARTVAESRSLAAVIRALGGDVAAHNYRRPRRHLALNNVSTDHMAGKGWARGMELPRSRVPAAELFDRRRVSTTKLRRKLILEGYKDHRCEGCGRTTWEGRPIPLELDHIDGDRTNNRLENLRLLCPQLPRSHPHVARAKHRSSPRSLVNGSRRIYPEASLPG